MTTTVLSSSPISRRGHVKGKSSAESGLERASKSPKRRSSSRSHCARDGHRFESPQLHQEVARTDVISPRSEIARHFRRLCAEQWSALSKELASPRSSPSERVIALIDSTVCAVACVLMGSLR